MAVSRFRRSARLAAAAICAASPVAAQDSATLDLDAITVTAPGAVGTEGTGAYAAWDVAPSATGLPLTPRELPQSVSIVTDQEMTDQNFQTLNEVVDYTPGLFAGQGNGEMRWSYYARGSEIQNLQADGVPNFVHWYARDVLPQDDMAIYDRVEVVRGATGLLEGTGNPSASVNLVRKRPLDFRQIETDTGVTSFGRVQLTFDASTPLNESGTVRGRVVAKGVGGDGPRDNLTDDRGLVYGAVDFDLGERTTLGLGAMYAKENIDGYSWGGLWTRIDGGFYDFDSRTAPNLDWEYSHREAYTGYLDLEHRMDNGWKLKLAGRAIDGNSDMLSSYAYWRLDAAGVPELARSGGLFEYTNKNYSLDLQAAGPFTLFGRTHEAVVGMNGYRDKTRYDGGSYYGFVVADPSVADPFAEPKPPITPSVGYSDMRTEQYGAYAAARLSVTDQLKLIAGGRVTWFDYRDESNWGTSSYSEDAKALPYLGAVYDINETWTVYASYTTIFQPQQSYGPNGLLDPVEGTNVEAGVKALLLDGRLTAAAAVFQTDRDGLPEVIPNASGCGPTLSPTCYRNAELIRTQGAEFEISGAITDRWNAMASYTFANVEYEKGPLTGERYQPNVNPKNLIKLATSYRVPGSLEGLTVGGAMRYQSETYAEGTDFSSANQEFRIEQSGYAVVDLMARYDINERTALQVNVDNLFDKQYYNFWVPGYGNFIGAGRTATLTLSQAF